MNTIQNLASKLCPNVPCAAPVSKADWHLPPMVAFVGATLTFVGISFAAGAPSPLYVLFQQNWHFPAWILTIAFGIYAITLLATLLVAGSLSDHIGRRPVMIAALLVELISMVMFIFAPNVGWIIVARAIQGIATGAATSTLSAALVELAPERHKKLGTLISSTAPVGGLALGALFTGLAIQFTIQPVLVIFSFLVVVFIAGTLVVILSSETVSRRQGALRSLVPRLGVPHSARHEFAASIPVLVATWMLAGLFLGLAPSIIRGVFHIDSGLLNGGLVALQPAAGTIAGLVSGRFSARKATIVGAASVLVGVAIVVSGIVAGLLPLLFIGVIIGGSGFGASFSGVMRIMAPLAGVHQRAELFAAIYLVGYLAFGVPVLIAGQLIGLVGLLATVIGYGTLVVAVGGLGLLIQVRLGRARG